MTPKVKAVDNYIRLMKTQEECVGFIDGYEKCAEDMADKKYTDEDIKKAYNEGYRDAEAHSIEFPYKEGNVDNRDISEFKNAEYYINSLNKQFDIICPKCGGDSWKFNAVKTTIKYCKCGNAF